MRRLLTLALLLFAPVASAQVYSGQGFTVKPSPTVPAKIGTTRNGLWSQNGTNYPMWQAAGGASLELLRYPIDVSYPPSAFSANGTRVLFQAGIAGGNEFFRIDPNETTPFNPPWSCQFGEASNAPAPGSDAQVGCGWNIANPVNTLRGHMSWNMESDCNIGTGCAAWTEQMEWYNTFGGPTNVSSVAPAWQFNHTYLASEFVTNGGKTYFCNVGGTSAASGGPTGESDTITDGTVNWRYYAGYRWMTANGRVLDGNLSVGIVGNFVGLGYGHSINDAGQVFVNSMTTQIQSQDGNLVVNLSNAANIKMITLPAFGGAGVMEVSPNNSGEVGFRGSIVSYNGDGNVNVGHTQNNPALRGRMGWGAFKSLTSLTSALPVCSSDNESLMTTLETDYATRGSLNTVCNYGQVLLGTAAVVPRRQGLAAYDIYGDSGGPTTGNGTHWIGEQVVPPWNVDGATYAVKLTMLVRCRSNAVATSIEITGAFRRTGAGTPSYDGGVTDGGAGGGTLTVTGPVIVVYRTPAAGGGAGTGWTADITTGLTGGIQPTITVTDGENYDVHWTMTGQSLTAN
jgi:hypothetical protein